MSHRATWFIALFLSACTMGLEFAHVLEWGPKDGYSAALYTRLQESLYFWFGTIGAAIYILAIAITTLLAIRLRHDPVKRSPVRIAAGLEVLALASFLVIIYPVNQHFPVHGGGAVPAGWAVPAGPARSRSRPGVRAASGGLRAPARCSAASASGHPAHGSRTQFHGVEMTSRVPRTRLGAP